MIFVEIRDQFIRNELGGIKVVKNNLPYLIKIDCLYELFVTHLGCSLFWPRRIITISN